MSTIKRFEDLNVWQEARKLCLKLNNEIFERENVSYALLNQMDRSSGSIMDNIAEGFERNGNKEFRQYLTIAKGSCGELRSQLYRAFDRNNISEATYNSLNQSAESIAKMISGMIKYLNSSDYQGSKFKASEEEHEYFTNILNDLNTSSDNQ